MWVEIIGIIATLLIVISMSVKTTTYKGDLFMRIFNLLGSVIFTVYGILLPAISTAILNGLLIFINFYHIIVLYKHNQKELQNSSTSSEQKKED